MLPIEEIRLSRWPKSAKILVSLFLFAMLANHIFSLLLSYHVTHEAFTSTEEYFEYQQDTRKLLRMSHQHAFGHGIIYFILGALLCFTGTKEGWKLFLIPLPFIGAGLDQSSWWLLKFAGMKWEWLSYFGGALFSFGFFTISLLILHEVWFFKPNT